MRARLLRTRHFRFKVSPSSSGVVPGLILVLVISVASFRREVVTIHINCRRRCPSAAAEQSILCCHCTSSCLSGESAFHLAYLISSGAGTEQKP
eukprot:4926675-Pleurochrysis_carterae.AAC.3